jgi:hypothetical protein
MDVFNVYLDQQDGRWYGEKILLYLPPYFTIYILLVVLILKSTSQEGSGGLSSVF